MVRELQKLTHPINYAAKNASNCALFGSAAIAPFAVVANAPEAFALRMTFTNVASSFQSATSESPASKPLTNASPAPVVSTGFNALPATIWLLPWKW